MGPEGQYVTEVKRLLSLLGLEVQGQFPGYLPFPNGRMLLLLNWLSCWEQRDNQIV